jgi:exodeoxyribonuclease VII large subunit
MELPERKIYTVSELTARIRDLLEKEYPSVWVQGEISNFRPAPSGHNYFTLKDDSSQIRCVMFKTQSRFLKFRPEDGLDIIAWGQLSVYSPRGEYQLILDTMEPMGLGSLMLAFEQLKKRLRAEGLFDQSRKKPLPVFPRRIGLVTSPRGAAVRDMIRIIRRRFPGMHILISPSSVQGDKAPDEIVTALERLCKAGDVDAVIIGRGGGSVEDLWAFNEERVVRAVAVCPLPIVSAVGHETDFTLTDFAADLRASTPSAAAEVLVPDQHELASGIGHLNARIKNSVLSLLRRYAETVNETIKRLYDPRRQIQERRMGLDDLTIRLGRAMERRLNVLKRDAETTGGRLRPEHLRKKAAIHKEDCSNLRARLERIILSAMQQAEVSAKNLSSRLDALSPLAVLARGYSITIRPDSGDVITDAGSVEMGDELQVRLFRGRLSCRVVEKQNSDHNPSIV